MSKTTLWGIVGGMLSGLGDYIASGATITLRGVLTALGFVVLGKLSADQKKGD